VKYGRADIKVMVSSVRGRFIVRDSGVTLRVTGLSADQRPHVSHCYGGPYH